MPCRPLLLDLGSRNCSICRSCLASIRRQAAQPWAATYSSKAVRKAEPKAPSRIPDAVGRQPSPAELQKFLKSIQELQGPKKGKGECDFDVRFFEQDGQKRTELPDELAFDSLDKFDGSELKRTMLGFHDALETQEEKDALQTVMRQVGADGLDKTTSEEDLEKMLARMEAYSESIDVELEEAGADLPKELMDDLRKDFAEISLIQDIELQQQAPPPRIPEKPWTPNQRRKVSRLNVALAQVWRGMRGIRDDGQALTKKSVSSVYKAYHAARLPLAHGWSNVPVDVWDLLWTVLSADESINIHRLSHISLLARDMSEAKVTLSPAQQLATIEAVFVDGWEAKAVDNWKRCAGTLGDDKSETFQDFWELGVRMFCRMGNLEQAERAVSKLLDKRLDARILMPLIGTLSEQGTPESQEKAWAEYRRMRELLGRDMKLSDYDQVVSYFLTTNQTENALYAFVDMMTDGQMDLKRQKYMPSVVANKFFLGKWLKRLIGAGDLDGALSVVEFMRTKGVEAAPMHLNGLIGAWQRAGGADDIAKADRLAWDMVESRISFVRARKLGDGSHLKASAATDTTAPWPRATLETFSLLAANYRLRDLHGRMGQLWHAFRDAEISPDAFAMNQLLESHIQAGQHQQALALYRSLVAERAVAPDPYTFSALWKTLAVNRLHVLPAEALGSATEETRRLFAETVRFRGVFAPGGMDGQLARKALHTFRRLGDRAGFVVALAALRDLFGFLPPEMLVLELVVGTAKLSWDTPGQRRRLLTAKRGLDRELPPAAAAAAAAGDADGPRREALYRVLRKRYWPDEGAEADQRRALDEAARQMGVYGLLAPLEDGSEQGAILVQ